MTLPAFQYRFADEIMLHEGIATVLDEGSIQYQREFVAGVRFPAIVRVLHEAGPRRQPPRPNLLPLPRLKR